MGEGCVAGWGVEVLVRRTASEEVMQRNKRDDGFASEALEELREAGANVHGAMQAHTVVPLPLEERPAPAVQGGHVIPEHGLEFRRDRVVG